MYQLLNNVSLAQLDKGRIDIAVRHCLAALRTSGLSLPASADRSLSLASVLADLPADYNFTPDQELYLATLMLCHFSERGVAEWSGLVAPWRRFGWSPQMAFNILVNQAISHWVTGDLDSHPSIVAEADRALLGLKDFDGPNFAANRAYHFYLKVLLQGASRPNVGPSSRPMATVVGDSHGLSYAGLDIEVDGRPWRTRTELVMGGKAWHLAMGSDNRFRHRFEWAIGRAPEDSLVVCSFGEIDCRIGEGILPFYRKRGGNLEEIVRRQTAAYVACVRDRLRVRRQTPLFLGVPAPFLDSPYYDLDGATPEDRRLLVEIIRLFNDGLRQAASAGGFGFADLYALTNDRDGKASGRLHNDSYHLRPEALALALALERR